MTESVKVTWPADDQSKRFNELHRLADELFRLSDLGQLSFDEAQEIRRMACKLNEMASK